MFSTCSCCRIYALQLSGGLYCVVMKAFWRLWSLLFALKIVCRAARLFSFLHFRCSLLHSICRKIKAACERAIFLLWHRIRLFPLRAHNVFRSLRCVLKDQMFGSENRLIQNIARKTSKCRPWNMSIVLRSIVDCCLLTRLLWDSTTKAQWLERLV